MARRRLFLRLIPLTLVLLSGAWLAGLTPFAAARAQVQSQAPDLASGPRLAAGDAHTCAIDDDGAVACWGDNTWDQAPQHRFAAEGRFVQVAAGGHHTCALREDGAVECWGAAATGGNLTRPGPFVQVSAGSAHSCAVSPDGLVACWGENGFGQAPAVTSAAQNRFVQVSAGAYHTCGLRDDGLVECWGAGGADAGMFPHHGQAPAARAGTTAAITAVSAGAYHTCALTAAGQVECWGLNASGQAAPIRSAAFGAFAAVSAGGGHTCALSTAGTIECWGWNDDGQAPLLAQPATGAYVQAAAGLRHTCGLTTEGRVDCWGNNESGQAPQARADADGPMALSAAGLEDMTMSAMAAMTSEGGIGSADGRVTTGRFHSCALRTDGTITCWGPAAQTAAPTGTFIQVSAGNFHTCALRGDRTAVCWGENADGQTNAPGGTFAEISAGGWYTCGLRPSGDVTCWGSNLYGQLQSPVGPFVQISAGQFHMCALRNDRQLNCWGNNGSNRASPPSGRYREVTAGGYHSCAVRYDGGATCWGDNTFSKTSIPSGTGTVAHISAGQDHTCAIRTNGTMVCWGNNQQGQTTVPTGTPTPTYTQVAAGGFHTCAARAGGSLVCWGQTSSGQSTVPGGGATFGLRQVTGGESHSCGLKSDGSLTCWGSNHSGMATPPGGLFNQVSASRGHTCAIRDIGTVACWGTNFNNASTPPASVFRQISLGGESACGVRADGSLQCWGSSLGSTPSATRFIEVSLGFSHACTIRDTGLAVCWGVTGNDFGEATAPSGVYFKQLSLGTNHSCGVRGNGGITCWGRNNNGQSTPPGGLFTQVTAGVSHACGITDSGTVACWGLADERIQAPAGTFLQIEAGYHHTCGIRTDGTLSCWGDNSFGRAPRLSINPTGLIDATRQMAYSQTLTATGGTGPYTFSFGSGTLPPGLSVGSNGVLSGTPTTAGTFTFTIRVADSSAMPLSALQSFTLRVVTIVNGVCTVGPSGAHYTTINGAIGNLHCQTITVPAGTYREMLSIGRSLTINGAGTSSTFLDGEIVPGSVESYRRVVNITAGTVTLTGLTVRNGRARPTLDWSGGLDGGGIRALSGTSVTLRDVAVSGSTASSEGGGIASYGTLTLDNVSLTNNTATTGGGLYAGGAVTLDSVTMTGNQALGSGGNGRGGGMYILGDTIADRLAVIDNTASSTGGGIYRDAGQFNQGSLTLRRSLIANNNAAMGGGLHTSGDVHLINVTVTSNTGEGISGSGGMFSGPAINLSSVTLSHNGGGGYSAGGITRLVARNTIFASNTGRNCVGGIVNLGNNIRWPASDTSCYDAEPNFPQPVPFVDPQLGALAANGGPAQTRALGAGSAAIDAGTCVDVNNNAIATDQRGIARPQPTGWHCDIGAFEVERVREGQTITFAALADKTYGDAPFTISASASSGLLVNFSVSGSCTVSASSLAGSTSTATVTLTAAGFCTMTASQAGDTQYAPAGNVERVLKVKALPQFTGLSSPTIDHATASVALGGRLTTPTAIPSGTVAITLNGVTQHASIADDGAFSTVFATSAIPAGTYPVALSYAGDDNVGGATASTSLVIRAISQFGNLATPNVVYGTPSTIVSGRLLSGEVTPIGSVVISLAGISQEAPLSADGTFSGALPTGGLAVGSYPIQYAYAGSATVGPATASSSMTIVPATPQFTALASPGIDAGTSPTTLSGRIVAGALTPSGNVSITLAGTTAQATIAPDGTFSTAFDTSGLASGAHVIAYSYPGSLNFAAASSAGTLSIFQAACEVTPEGEYGTIQSAVDALCRTITVGPGIYHEEVTITRDVAITGAGAGLTIVDNAGASRGFTIHDGTVSISDLTVRNGRSPEFWQGMAGGGGISNGGRTFLTRVVVSNNVGPFNSGGGGGIFNRLSGTLTLHDVTVHGNRARSGGGILNEGVLTISHSTVSGNTADFWGGGLQLNGGDTRLTNVTVTGNDQIWQAGPGGGGIALLRGWLELSFVTLTHNSAAAGGGGILVYEHTNGSGRVRNSIIAQNQGLNCGGRNALTYAGHNLRWPESDDSCQGTYGDPKLADLGEYGGPTATRGLLAGSAALDAIPREACTDGDGNPVGVDQRGSARPLGAACDIGAVEGAVLVKVDQTIEFAALSNRTYGDAPFTVHATASSGLLVGFDAAGACTVSSSMHAGGVSSATVSLTGAGSCTITASQAGNGDVNPAADVQRSFTIAQAAATLSLRDLVHTYSALPWTATVIMGEAVTLNDITVTYNGSTSAPVDAGTYEVVATLVHPDYSAAPATGTLVIEPAPVTITPDSGKTKAYGQTFTVLTGSVAGLQGTDAIAPVYASAGTGAIAGIGAYDIAVASYSFTSGLASNYSISTNVAVAGLTVGPASLTIVPDAGQSKTFGQTFSAFTGTVSGLVNGDQVVPVYASAGAAAAAGAGAYDITVASYAFTTGSAANYTVSTGAAAGGLTVGQAALTITPDGGKTKTYGQPFSAFTGTLTGVVNGDQVVPVYASAGAAAAAGAGTYDITVESYAFTTGSAANYTVSTGAAAGGLTVGQAALTITPDAGKTKTYGQPFSAFTGTLTGLVDGDQVAPVYASAGAAAAAGAGTYDITVESYAFTTGSAANYTVHTGAAAGGLIVNPAALTIAADPKVKQYLAPLPAFTVQHSGFVNGESPAVLGGTTTCGSPATDVSVVGTYPVTCDGQSSANYTISYVPSTLTITPLPIAASVTFSPASPQYSDRVTITASIANAGGLPPASGMTFSIDGTSIGTAPFVLNGAYYTASVESSALMLPPGTVTVAPTFAGANLNYVVSYSPAPLLLTITPEDARFTYTGLEFVTTPSARDTVASVVLSATVQDIAMVAGGGAYDQNAGDIRQSRISFIDRESNKVLCSNLVPVLVDTDPGTGTVACTVVLSTGSNGSQQYRIGMEATGHYVRNASEDDAVVTVSQPINSMITGGGHLINQASTGQYAGGAGLKTRAGFSVKYNKSLTNLQGSVRIVVVDSGKRVYEIKSNSLSSLATNLDTGTASFLSKATLTDITNPAKAIALGGNLNLQMTLTDAGAGPLDTLGITLSTSSGALLFSSRWNGAQTVEQNLKGGNLVVR